MQSLLDEIQTYVDIPKDVLIPVIFDTSRIYDSDFVQTLKQLHDDTGMVFNTVDRKKLRKRYYYGGLYTETLPCDITPVTYTQDAIQQALSDSLACLKTRNTKKIVESWKQRVTELTSVSDFSESWLNAYKARRIAEGAQYALACLYINQDIYKASGYSDTLITDFLKKAYHGLENHRYMTVVIDGELYNAGTQNMTWRLIYQAGIFAENFIRYTGKFRPFNRTKKIAELTEFCNQRGLDAQPLITAFFEGISYGYRFEDLYISSNQRYKILILRKISPSDAVVPCPFCNSTKQTLNSYKDIFLKTWECKNPKCPECSKSGRGKRFDEYGTYRYFCLVEDNPDNRVPKDLYSAFRRDIFAESEDWQRFLLREYSYSGESVYFANTTVVDRQKRVLIQPDFTVYPEIPNMADAYSDIPIVKLFSGLYNLISVTSGETILKNDLIALNDNSTVAIQTFSPEQIGTVMTSPPYYNAREYSQWHTLLMYLVDMLISAKVIFNTLPRDAWYLYNIGDIVSQDNIYVDTGMSKHRIPLGFLSSMLFEICGYSLIGNKIWDKGEVQSKRSSTCDMFSGYVKCINCYEHVLCFCKGTMQTNVNTVARITPVIKINNKKENTVKHTAPYPLDLVALVAPYIDKSRYVLDPFLGSGTTLRWCKDHRQRAVGIEQDVEYFEVCKERLTD